MLAGIGRTWVDDILWTARLSPFKRGDDLSEDDAAVLRDAIAGELGRAVAHYAEQWKLPLPDKQDKVARIHAHQGEPCPRCGTVLEAVFFEDYVMTTARTTRRATGSSRTAGSRACSSDRLNAESPPGVDSRPSEDQAAFAGKGTFR